MVIVTGGDSRAQRGIERDRGGQDSTEARAKDKYSETVKVHASMGEVGALMVSSAGPRGRNFRKFQKKALSRRS